MPNSEQINFSKYELEKLKEIQNAISIFGNESHLEIVGEAKSLAEAFNLPGSYVKKMAIFCKKISSFDCLQQATQIILMKQFFFYLVLIRMAFSFDDANDGSAIPIEVRVFLWRLTKLKIIKIF